MLRTLALPLLPIALFLAACGGSGESSEPPAADADREATVESSPDAPDLSAGDSDLPLWMQDLEADGSGTLDGLLSGLDPFALMSGLGQGNGLPDVSQDVDPTLTAALLDGDDLPPEFAYEEETSFSIPGDTAPMELAVRMFATSGFDSAEPGPMVMSMAAALPPEALEELGSLEELRSEVERGIEEAGIGGEMGPMTLQFLNASGLGDAGLGMRVELDLSVMLEALAEGFGVDGAQLQGDDLEELPTGIAMEAFFFFREVKLLAAMVVAPLGEEPNVDAYELAGAMDEKAAAAE